MKAGFVNWNGLPAEFLLLTRNPSAGGAGGIYNVSGWTWWELVAITFNLDNSGGAVSAQASVEIDAGAISAGLFFASVVTSALSVDTIGGMRGPAIDPALNNVRPLGLGPLPVAGDGRVLWGFVSGDAGTVVGPATIVLVGERYENVKRA